MNEINIETAHSREDTPLADKLLSAIEAGHVARATREQLIELVHWLVPRIVELEGDINLTYFQLGGTCHEVEKTTKQIQAKKTREDEIAWLKGEPARLRAEKRRGYVKKIIELHDKTADGILTYQKIHEKLYNLAMREYSALRQALIEKRQQRIGQQPLTDAEIDTIIIGEGIETTKLYGLMHEQGGALATFGLSAIKTDMSALRAEAKKPKPATG